jgi:hypothetical protein
MSPEKPEIANTAKNTQRGAGFASVTPVVAAAGVVELIGGITCRWSGDALCRIGFAPNGRISQFGR